jgi:signal transduction histidine kinase
MQKRYVRKDGRVIWAKITASVIRGQNGHRQAVLEMVEDITEKQQMEADLLEVHRQLMQSREMERLQLAQDLHDGPLQELYGISYQLRSLYGAGSEEEIHRGLINAEVMLQKQIQTLRTICGELRPPTLAPFGLEKAIRSHSDTFGKTYPNLNVRLELMHDGQSISEKIRLALFRIYQELLNNVARHANANQVIVRLQLSDEEIFLEVDDNGNGFDVPTRWVQMARQGHLGLIGVSERAELVGGKMRIFSSSGKGTRVQVTVPRTFQEEMWNIEAAHNETMEKKIWDLSV